MAIVKPGLLFPTLEQVQNTQNRIDSLGSRFNPVPGSSSALPSSSNINLDSIIKAIDNGFSAYSSSALEYEKQATKDLQDFNSEQARLAFERSQSSAREQMAFQKSEREAAQAYNTLMSNTQYQRAVADLRAAGINPIIAVKGLSGSAPTISAQSGSSASASPASSSKADYSSALSEDKKAIDAIFELLNSSVSILKLFTSSGAKTKVYKSTNIYK